MKIAIIIGSIRIGRQSHKIAYYLESVLKARNAEVDMIDLIDHPLPLLEERVHLHPDPPREAVLLSKRLQDADAIILVSPEYHGSYSGVLKNAMDYFKTEFQKKPIGVVTATGGKLGGVNASLQLQHLVLHMGAYPVPLKLMVPEIQCAFDDDFNPLHERVITNSQNFINEFLWFANAITNAKKKRLEKELI